MTDPVQDGPFSSAFSSRSRICSRCTAALLPQRRLRETDPVAALYRNIHDLPNKRTALCLSGGGIRSATFALGVLQGLARLSLLKQFDYLSTVSGGGYIGSWLTAWIHRHPKALPASRRNCGGRPPQLKVQSPNQ